MICSAFSSKGVFNLPMYSSTAASPTPDSARSTTSFTGTGNGIRCAATLALTSASAGTAGTSGPGVALAAAAVDSADIGGPAASAAATGAAALTTAGGGLGGGGAGAGGTVTFDITTFETGGFCGESLRQPLKITTPTAAAHNPRDRRKVVFIQASSIRSSRITGWAVLLLGALPAPAHRPRAKAPFRPISDLIDPNEAGRIHRRLHRLRTADPIIALL